MNTRILVAALSLLAASATGYFCANRYFFAPQYVQMQLLGRVIAGGLPDEYEMTTMFGPWEERWFYRVSPETAVILQACRPGEWLPNVRPSRDECILGDRREANGRFSHIVFRFERLEVIRGVSQEFD